MASSSKSSQGGTPKRRGRPQGSVNHNYADVTHIPVACVSCNSTELRVVDGAKPIDREMAGTLPNGFQYEKIRWQGHRCEKCGQHLMVRTYFPANKNRGDIKTSANKVG